MSHHLPHVIEMSHTMVHSKNISTHSRLQSVAQLSCRSFLKVSRIYCLITASFFQRTFLSFSWVWHSHWRGKSPKRFITAFFYHSGIMQLQLSFFHRILYPVIMAQRTAWASLIALLEHRSKHLWLTEQLYLLGLFSSIIIPQIPEMPGNFRQFWLMPWKLQKPELFHSFNS